MQGEVTFIGFGEAAAAFALDWPTSRPTPWAFDIKTDDPDARETKLREYARAGVLGFDTAIGALRNAKAALSLVTADRALAAARACAPALAPGALWLDMNSVAPETKRSAAAAIEAAGGRYADVAVMAPVYPARRNVPLLVSGPHAGAATAQLEDLGYSNVRLVPGEIGTASAIKMIRSVLIKGLEALTTECVLAADEAGVRDEVIASLNASWPGTDWAAKADYNLERMIVHGERRGAEMEEVAKTLDALGTGSAMARATVEVQRALGRRRLAAPDGLGGKISAVLGNRKDRAA
jgi:3-hydroxyisobutyrate dehydrogenase-like beta-hydroxyacid dehydrogenase